MATRDFPAVFGHLREIMRQFEAEFTVVEESGEGFRLDTPYRRADGYALMFCSVHVKARYVSCHLGPVYFWPDLLDGLSPALRARMQGKTCFNFTRVDEALFAELDALTRRVLERTLADGPTVFD